MTRHRRPCESGQLVQRALADLLAEVVRGRRPARTEHEGEVERLDTEALPQLAGSGPFGQGQRVVAHGLHSKVVHQPLEHGRARSSAT